MNNNNCVEPSLEMILFCVRKLLDKKPFVRTINMTYCPSASVFDPTRFGANYEKYIVTTQRLILEPMASPQSGIVLYLFYRNKKTQYQSDPILSSCEMGIFYKGLFYSLSKIHINPTDVSGFVDAIIGAVENIQQTIDIMANAWTLNLAYPSGNSTLPPPTIPTVTPTMIVEAVQQALINNTGQQIII